MSEDPIGQIRRAAGNGHYYLVTHVDHVSLARVSGERVPRLVGVRITDYKRQAGHRGEYTLNSCELIPEAEVPDRVWVELAKWRLTQ